MAELLHKDLTDKILKAFFKVYNILGYGFLEKVYQNSLLIEPREMGLKCESQQKLEVKYKTYCVGDYFADIVVEGCIALELKAAESLCEEHDLQLVNYLKSTDIEVGLLLNFGKKPEFKRKVFQNDHPRKSV